MEAAGPGDPGTDSGAGEQEEGGSRDELAEESRKSEQEVSEGEEESHMVKTCAWLGGFLFCPFLSLYITPPFPAWK